MSATPVVRDALMEKETNEAASRARQCTGADVLQPAATVEERRSDK